DAMRTVVVNLAQSPQSRQNAREALRVAGKAAVPALVAHLQGRLAGDPATADPNALVPVLRALASKDPAIRLAAMNALRPLIGADARAADVLIEHLSD